jgi:hypothetical protein
MYEQEGLDFCRIQVKPQKGNGLFVTFNKADHFFIRRSGSTVSLNKKEIIDYMKNKNRF